MHDSLWTKVDEILSRHDLLTHPFYRAWSAGELTRDQLAFYGEQYLAHVAAFPTYLTVLHARLPEGETRRAVLTNAFEEEADGRSHAELWRDFVAGMGGNRAASGQSLPEIQSLVATFNTVAREEAPAAALAAFYAYESQVPRVAKEKRRGLQEWYGAGRATCEYFRVHETADVHHAAVWRGLLESEMVKAEAVSPEAAADCEAAILRGAERAARALWHALDGIEAARTQPLAASY
jgi:pyrroloquinoline-quinone synthase